jgi:hypothetical protein
MNIGLYVPAVATIVSNDLRFCWRWRPAASVILVALT